MKYPKAFAVAVLVIGFGLSGGVSALKQWYEATAYVLMVTPPEGGVHLGPSYLDPDMALQAARNYPTGGTNTWVETGASQLYFQKDKDNFDKVGKTALLRKFGLVGEVFAQVLLDPTTNTILTLPAAVRSGDFQSPYVTFTGTFETFTVYVPLPVDTDWSNSANSITFEVKYAADPVNGPWFHMCGARKIFGSGRTVNPRTGVPLSGITVGCSNRDTNNVLLPVGTAYRGTASIPNPMTAGLEITFPTS